MFNKVTNSLRNAVKSWLALNQAPGLHIQIDELTDHAGNVFMNEIWYRGDGYELEQLYKAIPSCAFDFWGAVPTRGMEIRKIHTGLPRIIVNTLTGTVVDDMQDIELEDGSKVETWHAIEHENNFKGLVKKAVKKTLVTGDGAFKISVDTTISQYPILEFFEADKIEVVRKRGRIHEIVFKHAYNQDGTRYVLKERYGKGYINYELYDANGKQTSLEKVPELAGLQPVRYDGDYMMAVYCSFYDSDRYDGRGQSIYDAKRDNFDALDEAWSQWMDALRANRTRTYIPEDLLPRDPDTGAILRGNTFDNRYIKTNTPMQENAQSKIETENGAIAHDSYLATYVTALDLCLQGVVSPSTLGIDTKKLDNAEAQREKEKTTLYTRQTIIGALQGILPDVINAAFKAYATMQMQQPDDTDVSVPFGEYANPSFESQVETVGKAKMQGVMSTESVVDELYGDTKDDDWKAEEVRRIKQEQGIAELAEPSLVGDFNTGV